ncbi:PREDICTED: signal recognition particle 19 kDa protein-like [Camelina sativa]|uniref:Signal recognition particle 19 kDa protein-like n=1 Tax=Camelina sativa TaxID=90675 RepID=A0ABM0V5J1_CAMSA|nr:PREDICTED: signal recognition particle 19 kDa protein-like [Camelina sativa]XP_010451105.1 PREDICTED: signal recognition particle 19 kDa protein-like [Camelina sativa]
MAIYDVVQLVRADVSTIALGIAASTASIILGAGSKGKQLMQNIAELVPSIRAAKKQESQKAKKQEPQAPTATSGTSSKSGKGGKKKR